MKVSVVLPTFNRRDIVHRTILKLFEQTFARHEYEIVVVVDGSTDGTAEVLRALDNPCELRIIEQENRGLAAARNAGLSASLGEIVIFLDDDMFSDPGLVSAHVDAHNQFPSTVCFGAFFRNEDNSRTLAGDCFELELGAFHCCNARNPGFRVPLEAWTFGNTSARRSDLIGIGGFDERFRMREDAELCFRLDQAGFDLRYVPSAVSYHFYFKTGSDLLRDAVAFSKADALMLETHPGFYPHSQFARLEHAPVWKRWLWKFLIHTPILPDALLGGFWRGIEIMWNRMPCWMQRSAVKALQWHRGLVWARQVSKG